MRHLKKGKKFSRKKGQRRAFLKSLVVNLISYGRIKTTVTRAKATKSLVERLITRGKKQNIPALRILMKTLPKQTAYKLYHEIAPRYKERTGGYTRIVKMSKKRVGDGVDMATIEFV